MTPTTDDAKLRAVAVAVAVAVGVVDVAVHLIEAFFSASIPLISVCRTWQDSRGREQESKKEEENEAETAQSLVNFVIATHLRFKMHTHT